MKKWIRNTGLGVAIVLVAAVCVCLWLYAVFVRGEHWTEDAGGHWSVEFVKHVDTYGEGGMLWYRQGQRRVLLADNVHVYRYYGDDCLAYESGGQQYFFVCGPRQPQLLPSNALSEWTFEPDALQEHYLPANATSFAKVVGQRVPIANAKASATLRPRIK